MLQLSLVELVISIITAPYVSGVTAPAYNCTVQANRGETGAFGARGCAGRGSPFCCNGSPRNENFPGTYSCIPDESLVLYGGGCSGTYDSAGCCPVSVANCTTLQAIDTPSAAFGHGIAGCDPLAPACCNGTPLSPNYPGNWTCVPDISTQKYGGNCSIYSDTLFRYPACCPK